MVNRPQCAVPGCPKYVPQDSDSPVCARHLQRLPPELAQAYNKAGYQEALARAFRAPARGRSASRNRQAAVDAIRAWAEGQKDGTGEGS